MKYIYSLLVIAGMLMTSCKDGFIELKPEDQSSATTFYQTESQFNQAVIAAYVPLRDLTTNDVYTGEMRSDNTHYELSTSRSTDNIYREEITNFIDESNNSYSNNIYFNCYNGISKANIVIERLPAAAIAETVKAGIDGQAKFLRAFYYFKLVRYFGGVPLFLKEVKKAEDAFLLRSSQDEVYAQIVLDAQDAVKELPAPAKFPQTGQATKGSATMLLAEVYMVQKKYAEAEALLTTLPAMGYGLNANYADAFLPTNKNSKESLFEVQYLEGTAAGSAPNDIYIFLPKTTDAVRLTGITSNNTGAGGWNTPTKDMISAYEANDKRLDASIGIAEGTYNTSGYLAITANKSVVNYVPAAGKIGVPYIKKYVHAPHVAAHNTNENWPVYRYSDALLLLAEAQNEQGKSALALGNLKLVRDRAGLPAITQSDKLLLRDIIEHERRIELAFENHRWNDLVRSGKAITVMNAYGTQLKKQYAYLTPNTYLVNESRLLYPIPQSERELNPALTQNPGYK